MCCCCVLAVALTLDYTCVKSGPCFSDLDSVENQRNGVYADVNLCEVGANSTVFGIIQPFCYVFVVRLHLALPSFFLVGRDIDKGGRSSDFTCLLKLGLITANVSVEY